MKTIEAIYKAIKKINPNAQASMSGDNINTLIWENGTQSIDKQDILNYAKGWRKGLRGKYNTYKDAAKKRGLDFVLTEDQFATFWQQPCHYCGDSIDTIGLDRIYNNLGYSLDNVVSCCTFCNRMKLNHTQEEFFDHVDRIYNNLVRKHENN